MATGADRNARVARYRRNRSRAGSRALPRPVVGTLAWIQARQKPAQPAALGLSPEPPEFYTREAAARRLGVGKTTVWELTSRGLLGVAYIRSKPLIPAAELERYIAGLIEEARERAETSYRPRARAR